jgi:WD40 repeat protein
MRSIGVNSRKFITMTWLGLTAWALAEPSAAQDGVAGLLGNSEFTLISSETSYSSFSPGKCDVIFCGKKGVMSMNAETRQVTTLIESPTPGGYLWAWMSPNSKLLLVVTRKGTLVIADAATKKATALKQELPKGFKRCVFSPDGTYFVAIGGMEDSELLYWELDEDKTTVKTSGESTLADGNTLYDGAFSPDGKIFATVSGSGFVDFWSRPPVRPVGEGTSVTRNGGLSGITFSSDGKTIAVAASAEPTITLVAPATGKVVKQIEWKEGHPLSGRKLAFLPRSNVLATADNEQVGFLDTDSGQSIGSVPAGGIVNSLKVSPDGRWLVAGTRERSVVFWRLKD